MNSDNLQRVVDAIENDPVHFDQGVQHGPAAGLATWAFACIHRDAAFPGTRDRPYPAAVDRVDRLAAARWLGVDITETPVLRPRWPRWWWTHAGLGAASGNDPHVQPGADEAVAILRQMLDENRYWPGEVTRPRSTRGEPA